MSLSLVTLQEAADRMGKSVQTLRRMIQKGELQTERVRTAQGFQYWVHLETSESEPAELPEIPEKAPLVAQPEPESEPRPETKNQAHEERLFFLRLIERLQNELDYERKKPHSLFGVLADWWINRF